MNQLMSVMSWCFRVLAKAAKKDAVYEEISKRDI